MATFATTAVGLTPKIRLGYWAIRGLAQPIRYLLEYTAGPDGWEDILYKQAGPTDPVPFDKSCWFDGKSTLGLDFPNLPYMYDEANNLKLTQSQSIIRHIARLHPSRNLLGGDLVCQAKVDLILSEFADCKVAFTPLFQLLPLL
jgi:glutathione S-transferase